MENACAKTGIKPLFPLWGMEEKTVIAELLEEEAELLVVALRPDLVDPKWLGQILNQAFIRELEGKKISPCGEKGEYHTFAGYRKNAGKKHFVSVGLSYFAAEQSFIKRGGSRNGNASGTRCLAKSRG